MTRNRLPARAQVDAETGELLAVTDASVTWLRSDGRRLDVTPDHAFDRTAIGGGAVAMAGEGRLIWQTDDATRRLHTTALSRLAVFGGLLVGAVDDGTILGWTVDRGSERRLTGRVDFEPETLSVSRARPRILATGWDEAEEPAMSLLDLAGDQISPTAGASRWPPSPAGAALLGDADVVGVGTANAVVLVGLDRRQLGETALPGLESLAGSGATIAWVRTPTADGDTLLGVGRVLGGRVVDIEEQPLPHPETLPHVAVSHDLGPVLVLSEGPEQIRVLHFDRGHWSPLDAVDLAGSSRG